MWQGGPEFLKQPSELWPIRKDQNESNEVLPDKIITVMHTSIDVNKTVIDTWSTTADNFNDYKTLIYVTALVLRIASQMSFLGAAKKITSKDLNEAEESGSDKQKTAYQLTGQ